MTAVYVILAIFACLLVFGLMISYGIFVRTVMRGTALDYGDEEKYKGTPFENFSRHVNTGKQWFEDQPKQELTLQSRDGLTLRADYLPVGDEKKILVFFHGYHSSWQTDLNDAVIYYASHGFSLLLPDQRAHGRSDGKFITYGVKERWDCVDWVTDTVRRHGDDCAILLGGVSMGCATVTMASALPLPENVKAIVADCGFTSPYAIMRHVATHTLHLPAGVMLLQGFWCKVIARFGLKEADASIALASASVPVLFIHGTADDFVPPFMTEQNYTACASEKRLLKVENAKHGESWCVDSDACKQAIESFVLPFFNKIN